jgi:hypothetical protein
MRFKLEGRRNAGLSVRTTLDPKTRLMVRKVVTDESAARPG